MYVCISQALASGPIGILCGAVTQDDQVRESARRDVLWCEDAHDAVTPTRNFFKTITTAWYASDFNVKLWNLFYMHSGEVDIASYIQYYFGLNKTPSTPHPKFHWFSILKIRSH